MNERELEEFGEWLEKLKAESMPIIVEGESDKTALEKLGVRKIIALLRRPLDSFVEGLKAKEVILMMDYDAEGKKLTAELTKILEHNDIKYNLAYWKMLPRFKVSHIEGIFTRFNKMNAKK